jgi:hypothetical protein
VEITASPGARVTLDAAGSYDPDHDPIQYHWWQYQEVSNAAFGPVRPPALKLENESSARASFVVPAPVAAGTVFHIILEVHDDGTPSLTSYRRVIVTVGAAPR